MLLQHVDISKISNIFYQLISIHKLWNLEIWIPCFEGCKWLKVSNVEWHSSVFGGSFYKLMRANCLISNFFPASWCHIGSLIWATVGVFTPWKSANIINQGLSLSFLYTEKWLLNMCQHTTGLVPKTLWDIFVKYIFNKWFEGNLL